jgi:uncharacterized repeat protein (TIGR01451 family)
MAQTIGQVGMPYSSFIGASGGTPPYTFKLNSGHLPPALMLNPPNGEIGSTPTTAGTFNFTVKVTDSSSTVQTAITEDCSITIIPVDLFILKEGPTAVSPGSVFDFTIRVENNGATSQHSVTVIDKLPDGGNFVSSQPRGFASSEYLYIPLGDLLPGASTTITVTWHAPHEEDTLVNSAIVQSSSSKTGPSTAEVSVRKGIVAGKLNDVYAKAAGTALRNRNGSLQNGNIQNGVIVDGIIKIPGIASLDTIQKAFLVWTVLFQGDVKNVSNEIGFRRPDMPKPAVLKGENTTPPNKNKKPQSGQLCWRDDATVGFVADVTDIVSQNPPTGDTEYIVSDPVNGAKGDRLNGPNGPNDPTPALPVTDGASLVIFYTIKGQPKTQALYDFTYDSNYDAKLQKSVLRKFTGVNVANVDPDLILVAADGQNAPDTTKFFGNRGTGLFNKVKKNPVVINNLWNGKDPLQYGNFKIGNLWDTLPMKLPKVLQGNTEGQTLEIELLPSDGKVIDCVGISGAVLVTPQ